MPANSQARRWLFSLACLLLAVVAAPGAEAACAGQTFDNNRYTVCTFDPAKDDIRLFNLDDTGEPYRFFQALADGLARQRKTLLFAMNAGMFDDVQRPIGLYVEGGQQAKRLNRRSGAGNFHLKPNGVFYVDGGAAGVMETEAFAKSGLKPAFATQSGPMLVIDGAIHPKFSASGTSRKTRNGVGVNSKGQAVFAISENAVTFHEFARLFRDELQCANALFFDGTVSSLYAPEIGRHDGFLPLGPMVGVVGSE